MNPDDLQDDDLLAAELRHLSEHAPAAPQSAAIHRALRQRTQKRITVTAVTGLAILAAGVAITWNTVGQRAPLPQQGLPQPLARTPLPPPDEGASTFRLISIGAFSPTTESTVKMPLSVLSHPMPTIGMEIPSVSFSLEGL